MEKIMEILTKIRLDVDFSSEKKLVEGNILTSFDIVDLIEELSDAYDIDIEADDIVPENFNSAEDIYQLVQRLLKEGQEAKK